MLARKIHPFPWESKDLGQVDGGTAKSVSDLPPGLGPGSWPPSPPSSFLS